MKNKAGLTLLTILFVLLSLACVSASDSNADDIVANDADSSVNPDDLDIQHNYNPDKVIKGQYFTLFVNVTNNGQVDYSNLSLFYNVPEGLEMIIWPSEYVNGKWTIDSLHPGESDTLSIVCMPTVSNVTLTPSLSDGVQTLSTLNVTIDPSADLAIDEYKTVENGVLYWFIHVVNNGPDDALNTVVSNLPDYLSYETDMGEVLGSKWNVGNLKNGSEALLKLVCEPYGEVQYNISVLSDILDPDMSNNNVSESYSNKQPGNGTSYFADKNATGNPLGLLMLTLFAIPLTRFKRIRK